MEKTLGEILRGVFNMQVNVEDEVSTNAMKPDNWDEMSEEEQKAWEEEHKMKDNSSKDDKPDSDPALSSKKNARQTQDPGREPGPDVTNLLKLNSLITEIGGFDAYKGLLLKAVDAVEEYQVRQNQEREVLVAAIVANSAGQFEEADLKDVAVPTLKKMAQAFGGHDVTVDYSMLNPQSLKANKDDVAPIPDLVDIIQNEAKKEAE